MKTYPRLTELGVKNPQQIKKFFVNSVARTDVLRIVYERPKDSLLPLSRSYKFPRIQKSSVVDSGTRETEYVLQTDPVLREVLDELHGIIEAKENDQDLASEIIEELKLLEEDIALRSEYIKVLVGKIQGKQP